MNPTDTPPLRHFEDYPAGAVFELGEIAVDADELAAFAQRFDPQPFHVDADAAAHSPYGGIIASGWHTGSLMMRLLATSFLSPASSLGSPGLDELRWPAPVRAGDRLSVCVTIESARRSASRPDRGVVQSLIETRNQDGVLVMSVKAVNLIRCRPTG
jgi:acyl dehydratase